MKKVIAKEKEQVDPFIQLCIDKYEFEYDEFGSHDNEITKNYDLIRICTCSKIMYQIDDIIRDNMYTIPKDISLKMKEQLLIKYLEIIKNNG